MNSLTQVLLDIARTASQERAMSPVTVRKALKKCLEAMEIQLHREAGEFHLSAHAFRPIWEEAMAEARLALAESAFDKSDELDDSERHEEREPSIDPQTGFES